MLELLYRETKHGMVSVNAEEEFIYQSVDGGRTILPFSRSWKKLLIQTSGGLDSSLLLYLTARAFKEMNLKIAIQPFSLEIPTKAKNLSSARAVIKKVRELVGYPYLLDGIETIMPIDQCRPPLKNKFFSNSLDQLFETEGIDFEYNGNTQNPPESARKFFPNDAFRELGRDNRSSIYNGPFSASPHAFNSKKGIVYLYNKFGILGELSPLTLSCDMNLEDMHRLGLQAPCGQCWWCHERNWGFASNNLTEASC